MNFRKWKRCYEISSMASAIYTKMQPLYTIRFFYGYTDLRLLTFMWLISGLDVSVTHDKLFYSINIVFEDSWMFL